jgi:predicted dehydrogenase
MKIVVIGLGSMGKRRIRLMLKDRTDLEVFGIDSNPDRRQEAESLFAIKTYPSLSEVVAADAAFVCTSPMSHANIIKDCLTRGWHVFSELNLHAEGYEENMDLAKQKNLRLFLSSTFLYRNEIEFIRRQVADAACKLNYSYHVGQYLPDWHPWESYKDYFIGKKETNGCREIFAIELPWITRVFGDIASIHVEKSKISSLEIDYPDNYLCLLTHTSGHKGMLAVDVVSRKAVRNLEVFGERLHIVWNGNPQELSSYDFTAKAMKKVQSYETVEQLSNYSATIIENAYLEEIRAFFTSIDDQTSVFYDFGKDLEILGWIDRIEGKDDLC